MVKNDEEIQKMIDQIIDFRCFIAGTIEYRKEQTRHLDELSKDVKEIRTKFDNLPCKERSYIPDQVRAIWAFIGVIIITIIVEWLRH